MPFPTYDTYQDVRKNLFFICIPVLNVAGFAAFNWILPPKHQVWAQALFTGLMSRPLAGITSIASGAAVFTVIAFLLVEVFKVHDRLYDRYVIRWRLRYDTDFILPRLVLVFGNRLDRRFFEVAERNLPDVMERIYYPFVGDRDLKIRKNLLVRFYERVTIYWFTQVLELVLVALVLLVAAYRVLGPDDPVTGNHLLSVALILVGLYLLNRIWVRNSREGVREATDDEVEEIVHDHRPELETRLRELCVSYQVAFT